MKKRILCAIMVVGMITGCGSKETTSNKTVENVSDKTEEKYAERMEAYLDYFQSEEKDYDGVVGAAITLDSDSLPLLWLAYAESEDSMVNRIQLCLYENDKVNILAEKKIEGAKGCNLYLGVGTAGIQVYYPDEENEGEDATVLIYDSEEQDFKFYDTDYFEDKGYFDSSSYKNEDDIENNYKAMMKDLEVYRIYNNNQLMFLTLQAQGKTAYLGVMDRNEIYSDYLKAIGALDAGTKLADKYKDNKFVNDILDEHFSKDESGNYSLESTIHLPDGTETGAEGMVKYYGITEDEVANKEISTGHYNYNESFLIDKDAEAFLRNLIKHPAYSAFEIKILNEKENRTEEDFKSVYGDIVDVKELLKDAADNKDNSVDSTESIRREDSTEISKETNNNMPDWKQAYIDYFNNSNLNVLDSKFIDTENKDIHLLACSIDNGSIDGKLFYINKKNEVVEIATYTLNRAVVRYNKYGCISILTTPTVYDSSFAVYKYDENSGSYPETYEGFAALDQDSFSKDGDMKYNCKINGNECDYESYQIEWNTYETGTGFEFIELSEASVGVSVIDTIKNY